MSRPCRFAVLADLHLSDLDGTAAAAALEWAVTWLGEHPVDFLAVAGDVTTYGGGPAMAHLLRACAGLACPVYHTPGNAERRGVDAMALLRPHLAPERRRAVHGTGDGAAQVLLPDTSTGKVPPAERAWLAAAAADGPGRPVVVTHYPQDKLAADDAAWLDAWLTDCGAQLLVAGHSHYHRRRSVGAWTEVTVPGLDPDKAIGGPPGLTLFERGADGVWTDRFEPWAAELELLPSDLPGQLNPVGWSVPGDPAEAVRETRAHGLSCLELRTSGLEWSPAALEQELAESRRCGPLYLSFHLPNLTWNAQRQCIDGEDTFRGYVERAVEAKADHLTVHVPRALSSQMLDCRGGYRPEEPSPVYRRMAALMADLLSPAAAAGARIAMENLHNPARTPVGAPGQIFGATIAQMRRWVRTMRDALPRAQVGVHLDVGHARNNGGELDNRQPLGDWYADLGRDVLGYHVHQVRTDPETGRAVNHRVMESLWGPRISYAGFLWAWSTRQLTRGPLFVEVRDADGRRTTARLLKRLFDGAAAGPATLDQLPG